MIGAMRRISKGSINVSFVVTNGKATRRKRRPRAEMSRELTYEEKMRALDLQAFQEAEKKKKKEGEAQAEKEAEGP